MKITIRGRTRVILAFVACLFALTFLVMRTNVISVHETNPERDPETTENETSEKFLVTHPQCGSGAWQREYARQHADMLKRPLPDQRIAVMNANEAGAGDRLTQVVTAFAYALLTERAFKIKWKGIALEEALHPRGVNWTYVESDVDPVHGQVEILDFHTYMVGYDNFPVNRAFAGNLSSLAKASSRTAVWRSNQGQLWNLFDNPLYRQQLNDWGLRPETAFGCIMHFLFKVRAETVQVLGSEWSSVLDVADPVAYMEADTFMKPQPHVGPPQTPRFVIGLQVRFGDDVFNGGNCQDDPQANTWSKLFVPCAETIEGGLNASVSYFLISDCNSFRSNVKQSLPPRKVTTYLGEAAKHIQDGKDVDVKAFRTVISELFLFSMTDFHVISSASSFGRVGSMMSLQWHQVFNLEKDHAADINVETHCARTNWEQYREYSHRWIRV